MSRTYRGERHNAYWFMTRKEFVDSELEDWYIANANNGIKRIYNGRVWYFGDWWKLSREETIRRANFEYDKWLRDGHWNESGRNKGFKRDAKKTVRRANKRFCNKVIKGDLWEDDPYPTRKLGKPHIWSWW